jgi:hypothetical protein
MKIELHISFDSMEDYNDFSSRLNDSSLKLKINERSPLKEEIIATIDSMVPQKRKIRINKESIICANPACREEFRPKKENQIYCSTRCYMHVYWSKRTKLKDGTVVLKDDLVKEKLAKLKAENPAPIKRPEYNRDC